MEYWRTYGGKVIYLENAGGDYKLLTFPDSRNNLVINSATLSDVHTIEHLVISDSIVKIACYSIREKGIKKITFGNNVKIIEYESLSNNEIEELDLPESLEEIESYAFLGNKIKYVHFKKNIKEVSSSSFLENPLEILEFDSYSKDIIVNFIKDYYDSLKKIIINTPLSVWQYFELKRAISWKTEYLGYNQFKIAEMISFDFEYYTDIEKLYVDIMKKLKSVEGKQKEKLLETIDSKMLEYASMMKEKPTYNESEEFLSMNKKQEKENELRRYLENILYKLNSQEEYYALKSKLEGFEQLLEGEVSIPNTFKTIEDEIKYIILVAKNFHNDILLTKLKYILELGKNKLDELIMNLDDVTLDRDINLIIEEMISLLFIKSYYFVDNISTPFKIIQSLQVDDDRYLSDIFMAIYYIIDMNIGYQNNKISSELKVLKSKYPYLNNFNLDMKIGELDTDSKEKIVGFINDFITFYENVYPLNNVHEDLYASLDFIDTNNHLETSNSVIRGMIEKIIEKASIYLKSNEEKSYQKVKKELKDVVNKWIEKIENLGEHILDDSNHYLVKNTNLSKESLVTILIMEDLSDIERKVEIYNISYEDYQNRKNLMK